MRKVWLLHRENADKKGSFRSVELPAPGHIILRWKPGKTVFFSPVPGYGLLQESSVYLCRPHWLYIQVFRKILLHATVPPGYRSRRVVSPGLYVSGLLNR